MKRRCFSLAAGLLPILIAFAFVSLFSVGALHAQDAAELFEKLTCHTCHGGEGRGMFRQETKATYRLKTKHLTSLKNAGHPKPMLRKLLPLRKNKYTSEKDFLDAVEKAVGRDNMLKMKVRIIELTAKVFYRKGDPIPGFELYPKLAGNNKIYLFRQMRDILAGKRTNGNTDAMRGIRSYLDTNNITDKELLIIADYLSKIK